MTEIALVPVYLAERTDLLRGLAPALGEVFGVPVEIRRPWFDPERCFDRGRGQYSSTLLLAQLQGADAWRVLGVAGVDLFIPVLSWVFGEAQVPGRAAVISLHRLAAELYGLPRDERQLAGRAEKEAVHELGHTFGLVHCRRPGCVMGSSTYVEEIDLKSARFCDGCLAEVRRGVPNNAMPDGPRQCQTAPENTGQTRTK